MPQGFSHPHSLLVPFANAAAFSAISTNEDKSSCSLNDFFDVLSKELRINMIFSTPLFSNSNHPNIKLLLKLDTNISVKISL
jgi:hypothetical protein